LSLLSLSLLSFLAVSDHAGGDRLFVDNFDVLHFEYELAVDSLCVASQSYPRPWQNHFFDTLKLLTVSAAEFLVILALEVTRFDRPDLQRSTFHFQLERSVDLCLFELVKSLYSDGTSLAYQPGFLAILGSDEGTTVVDIESAAYTLASDSLSNASYSPLSPGGSLTGVEIGPYEVLQILSASEPGCTDATACYTSSCCNTPSTYDLTGTVVRVVSGPNPAVFGGHDCAFVPFNKWACDHLEEQMFPLETWGTHYLCPRNVTQVSGEPTGWRVLSGADANEISFSPSSVHPAVTLDKGEFIEFGNFEDFEIVGEGRVSVAQFMVGQNYTSDTNPPLNGDPAMALAVPVEQYRTSYIFLAPTSYVSNYLTVVHKTGSYPSLDGITIAGDTVEITDEKHSPQGQNSPQSPQGQSPQGQNPSLVI
jgi:hypothetical protein